MLFRRYFSQVKFQNFAASIRFAEWRPNAARACRCALFLLVCVPLSARPLLAQVSPEQAVAAMVKNEIAAHQPNSGRDAFRFLEYERSARTGGHLWKEEDVQVDGGLMRRLLAVDGKPIPDVQATAVEERLEWLARNPAAFQRLNRAHNSDESQTLKLLADLPHEFLFTPDGEEGGCTRIAFRPDPAYRPHSFEDRAIHAMAGTVRIDESMMRLCGMQAHLTHTVEFGYGLLGKLNQGGSLSIERQHVTPADWKTTRVKLNFSGELLFFKSLSRQQQTVRTNLQPVPRNLTLEQAIPLTRP